MHLAVAARAYLFQELFIFGFGFLLIEDHECLVHLITATETIRTTGAISEIQRVRAIEAIPTVSDVVTLGATRTFIAELTLFDVQVIDAVLGGIDP